MQTTQTTPPSFTLKDVLSGRRQRPFCLMLAGVEGIGKTTFGASAPSPIFIGAEDGADHLDVQRLPQPRSWADVVHSVGLLQNEAHEFKTLVIDTVDWLEPLCWGHVCRRDNKLNTDGEPDIEAYGYGKGYQAALDEWRRLLRSLEGLRARGLNIILLAHTQLRQFKNPMGDDFDRYELKLNLRTGGLLKEWVDALLFANYETFAVKKDASSRAKGVSSGARYIYTERTAGYDAKNRYGLPAQLPLSWQAFETAARAGQAVEPKVLLADIVERTALLSLLEQEKIKSSLGRAGSDARKLAQIFNYVVSQPVVAAKEP